VLVLVEAACLTWLEIDTTSGVIVNAYVHALPDNVHVFPDGDVVASDPHAEAILDDEIRETARTIALTGQLPSTIDLRR
jgi:hypothetical protein